MSLTHLTDFSDRLSPMLVKELRQGMRARGFIMLFLAFQGLLAFILLSAGAVSGMDNAGSFASGVIFTLFIGAALLIQPMRSANTLSAEITGNTIEMMALTRLTAWRIVFGKWIAIVSQTALILITIIPYLILRYFFGGMVLLGEMVFLALIFLTSMSLTAINVGLSGNSSKIFRILPILFFILMINIGPTFLFRGGFNSFMDYCTLGNWESRAVIAAYVCFIGYLGWCALSLGTSFIAPVAENHSTLRRVVALVLAIVAIVIGLHPAIDYQMLPLVFGIILAPAVITALTEPNHLQPPIYQPFLKCGLPGRIASVFLLPGWPAGVFFSLLITALACVGYLLVGKSKPYFSMDLEFLIILLAVLGSVLLPALLTASFSKQENKRFGNFVVFVAALIILTIAASILTDINKNEQFLWIFAWNPMIFLTMVNENGFDKQQLLTAILIVDSIIVVLLLISAFTAFRGYREVFQQAEASLADREPPSASLPVP